MRDYKRVLAKTWLSLVGVAAATAITAAFYVEGGLWSALTIWGVIGGFALTFFALIYLTGHRNTTD